MANSSHYHTLQPDLHQTNGSLPVPPPTSVKNQLSSFCLILLTNKQTNMSEKRSSLVKVMISLCGLGLNSILTSMVVHSVFIIIKRNAHSLSENVGKRKFSSNCGKKSVWRVLTLMQCMLGSLSTW